MLTVVLKCKSGISELNNPNYIFTYLNSNREILFDQGYLKSIDAPEDAYDHAMRTLNYTMMDVLKIENCSLSKQLDAVIININYYELTFTQHICQKSRRQKAPDWHSSSSHKQLLNYPLPQFGQFYSSLCYYHLVWDHKLAFLRECYVPFSTLIFLRGLASHMLPVC